MATADEIRIAHEIMKAVRRLQLPLKLDEITEGRGNCFPHFSPGTMQKARNIPTPYYPNKRYHTTR